MHKIQQIGFAGIAKCMFRNKPPKINPTKILRYTVCPFLFKILKCKLHGIPYEKLHKINEVNLLHSYYLKLETQNVVKIYLQISPIFPWQVTYSM